MATFDINSNERNARLVGNGSLATFDFSFQVNNTSDIKVYVDGDLKVESVDYDIVDSTATLGLNTDGTGTVRFVTASIPANNEIVSIVSDVPFSRTGVYTSGGNITAQALEDDFDTIAMQMGDVKETLSRAVVAPVSDPTDIVMVMPDKATRLNKVLGFDATTGEPVARDAAVSSVNVDTVTTVAFGVPAAATVSYDTVTGELEFNFTIPQGAQGNNGVFSAIATTSEAELGVENTKGMTALRVKEAIDAQVASTTLASKFFGVYKDANGNLIQEHTLVGGPEALKVSDYDTYFFATGAVSLKVDTNGHLLINLP